MKQALTRNIINTFLLVDGKRIEGKPSTLRGYVSGLRGDVSGLRGDVTGLRGDVSGLIGDVTGLRGDVSGLIGDIDQCEITIAEREKGIDISLLVINEGVREK